VAAWVLNGPLTLLLAGVCCYQLLLWVPSYLTWPFWADQDVFATLAHGWEHGLLPYRDMPCNNFPGTIYLFWLLGKGFGWGRTLPLFALDAGLLLPLGAVLLFWSWRRLGCLLPGLVAYAALLSYYLGLDYTQVAQRDWHAPCLAVAALLLLEASPGLAGAGAAALLFALGFAVRPQVVLLLPAALLALDGGVRQRGGSPSRRAWAGLSWLTLFLTLTALTFLPLVRAGVWQDFLRNLSMVGPGGSYNRLTPLRFGYILATQVGAGKIAFLAGLTVLLFHQASPALRETTLTWALAAAGLVLYKPLSPCQHLYLDHPLQFPLAVLLAVCCRHFLQPDLASPVVRLAGLIALCGMGITLSPSFVSPKDAFHAVATDWAAPAGYVPHPLMGGAAHYRWKDYQDVIQYLRTRTPPHTRVANLLREPAAITGPAARPSVFPAESLVWLVMVRPDDLERFLSALEGASNSVVVWVPGELRSAGKRRRFEPLVRRLYEPQARFGEIEVWRRKPDSDQPGVPGGNRLAARRAGAVTD
jgi:hypothetical protein